MSAPAAPPVHRPIEALALFALGLGLSVGIAFLPANPSTELGSLRPLLMFLAWVAPAYALAARRGHDPLVVHGVLVPTTGLRPAALVSLAVLATYALGFVGWAHLSGRAPTGDPGEVTRNALEWLAWGFVFVALPEEYFFRGVLQPALDGDGRGRSVRVLGADLGRGAVLSSVAFGVGHIIIDVAVQGGTTLERAATGFSALWFAWLRARTGSVLPAAVAHALANAVFQACHQAYAV